MEAIACFGEDSEDGPKIANKTEKLDPDISDIDFKSNSDRDFQSLRTKLRSLERSLEEQRVTCNYLREERNEALTLNSLLKREVEDLRRGIHTRSNRPSPEPRQHEQSTNYNRGPLAQDEIVTDFIFALPRKLVRGLVNRAALFVWWTGVWANEGLGFLQFENKWVELQRVKYQLEEDNSSLENQVYSLQELLTEKEIEIVRQIEQNKDLTKRLKTQCGIFSDKSNSLDKMAGHIHTVAAFSESLSEEIERIKAKLDRRLTQFEGVHRDIARLTESQRLLEITGNNLERRLDNLADAHAHDCHNRCFEPLQARAVLPNNVASEKPISTSDTDKSRPRESGRQRCRVCGIFCGGFCAVMVFLLAFLVTAVLVHFALLASSLTLPSVPEDEFSAMPINLCSLFSFPPVIPFWFCQP